MTHKLTSRSTSNRLILSGCLLLCVPCLFALASAAFFCWPILLPGGIR
jgi:hypothetical protein